VNSPEIAKPFYSPAEIAGAFTDNGYKAQINQLENGRKVIYSAASGYKFSIFLIAWNKDDPERIESIQFYVYFSTKVSLKNVNAFNARMRFIKAYCDGDGNVNLEWDVLVAAVAPKYIKECIGHWDRMIGDLRELFKED
jgi:hypothetical protein